MLLITLLLVSYVSRITSAKIGYFWHITDIHLDTHYHSHKENSCWRGGTSRLPLGKYGDYNCDSPWALIESAAYAMKAKHGENIEFVLWTGDALSNPSRHSPSHNFATVRNLTHLFGHVFSSQFVFPVLGHDDPRLVAEDTQPYRHVSSLWRHWLPSEALSTFNKGGFYSIEQKTRKLRLVALNTNLWTGDEGEGEDPGGQWIWLETLMAKSYRLKETIYLVGHMPPGTDERLGNPPRPVMSPRHNARYLRLVRKYADIITGQFFGHLHSDTFRVIYNEAGRPVSNIYLSPSLTPKRSSSGFNNPGIRLYKFNSDTGQVIDYVQYYLDLSTANQRESADWTIEYNLTTYYGFHKVSPSEFHDLAESFTITDGLPLFARYYLVNSVSTSGLMTSMNQAHSHYCAITRLDTEQFYNCLATAPSALFSKAQRRSFISNTVILLAFIISFLR